MELTQHRLKCHAAAIRLLAAREHSAQELSQKLLRKNFPNGIVDQVLSELQQNNLQSDRRYAENVLESRRRRGYGPVYIQHYLQEKGVDRDVIEEVLDFTEITWQKTLGETAVKKFGANKPDHFQQTVKQMNFLQRRGFTNEQIRDYYAKRD